MGVLERANPFYYIIIIKVNKKLKTHFFSMVVNGGEKMLDTCQKTRYILHHSRICVGRINLRISKISKKSQAHLRLGWVLVCEE